MSARQKFFTIAPHAPFLETLVERVCDGSLLSGWDVSGPFGLSDVTIILPTRRSRLVLAEAFAERLGGAALLPDIRTFGGAPEEEEPFLPPFDAPPLPAAIAPLRRKLMLAQLVEGWIKARDDGAFAVPGLSGFSNPSNAGEILALAESLAELIDDFHVENLPASALGQIAPDALAANWQATLDFLNIAFETWPQVLEELGQIDGAAQRNLRLERQTGAAELIFGDRPIIAAGSTGSIPATANLLQAIAKLERGVLVLPGLDTSMDEMTWDMLRDEKASPHGHPQYGLARLLSRLGTGPAHVDELVSTSNSPRTKLVRHGLALAEMTAGWANARAEMADDVPAAMEGLAIAIARTDEEQARAIALAARDALAREQSVGIISPDRNLARRIASELARFNIEIDDSAGTPLFQSRVGRLARQILAVARNRFAPVDLMALLRNRHMRMGMARAELVETAGLMEVSLLRGQRPMPGVVGLRALLAANLADEIDHVPHRLTAAEGLRVESLLAEVELALAPLVACLETPQFSAAEFAIALGTAMTRITAQKDGTNAEPVPGASQFSDWLNALKGEIGRGPKLSASGIESALEGLMTGVAIRPTQSAREDIAIWGQLEARLQNPDLMILAGLSEGVWPEAVDPGPWLSRSMRMSAGLEPPERRQGQAAHDFEMAMGNKNVLITRSERIGTSPAVPSRLLQRIEAFLGEEASAELTSRGAIWVQRARDLDFAGPAQPARRPEPKPPASVRPRSLSITEVETLVRSPYDLYAKYVLGLRKLDALGDDPGARERGTLIHNIFGRFVEEGHDPVALDAMQTMLTIAAEEFRALDALPERQRLWLERFKPAAEGFLGFERARANRVAARHAELSGKWVRPISGEDFTLRGRADRIDVLRDGTLEIIDFKTGAVPSASDMRDFTAPQLLLEAAMAEAGAFDDVPPSSSSALTYIKIGAGPEAFVPSAFATPKEMDISGATGEVIRRLSSQVGAYLLRDDISMSARIFPNPNQRFAGDYDHLARTGEWTLIDGGEDGE